MMPPSKPMPPAAMPAPFKVGDEMTTVSVKDGSKRTRKIVRVGDNTYTSRSTDASDTCETTKRADMGFFLFVEWKDCRFGSGTRTISNMTGSLWPLEVGKKISFDVSGVRTGGRTWNLRDTCEVKAQTRLKLPYGEDDVYKIVCTDRLHRLTSYFSPKMDVFVKTHFVRTDNGRVLANGELVSTTK